MEGKQYMQLIIPALYFVLIFINPVNANAYIGPGLGAGTIGVILGVLGSVFIALFAIIWYPLKRLLKKMKKREEQDTNK